MATVLMPNLGRVWVPRAPCSRIWNLWGCGAASLPTRNFPSAPLMMMASDSGCRSLPTSAGTFSTPSTTQNRMYTLSSRSSVVPAGM